MEPGRVRLLPRLIIIGAAVGAVRPAVQSLWTRFVYLPNAFPNQSQIPSEAIQFGASLLAFAISPCLLFAAYYHYAGGVSLDSDADSLLMSLLAGGAAGVFLGIFTSILVFPVGSISDYFTALAAQFGDVWGLGLIVVALAGYGLYNVFVGFVAVFFASRRNPSSRAEAGAQTTDAGAASEPTP